MLHHSNLEGQEEKGIMWDNLSPRPLRDLCSPTALKLRRDPLMDVRVINLHLEDPEATLKQEDHGESHGMSQGVLLVILNHLIGVSRVLTILDNMAGILDLMMEDQISEGLLEKGFMDLCLIGRAF